MLYSRSEITTVPTLLHVGTAQANRDERFHAHDVKLKLVSHGKVVARLIHISVSNRILADYGPYCVFCLHSFWTRCAFDDDLVSVWV